MHPLRAVVEHPVGDREAAHVAVPAAGGPPLNEGLLLLWRGHFAASRTRYSQEQTVATVDDSQPASQTRIRSS